MSRVQSFLLRRLIKDRGRVCEFCGEEVVRVSAIPENRRISVTSSKIRFRDEEGQITTLGVATVEHVIRKADGGTNSFDNLKLSCFQCNQLRAALKERSPRTACRGCGRSFSDPGVVRCRRRGRGSRHDRRKCTDCIASDKRISKLFSSKSSGPLLGDFLIPALNSENVPKISNERVKADGGAE